MRFRAVILIGLWVAPLAHGLPHWSTHFGIRSADTRLSLRVSLEAARSRLRGLASIHSADTAQRAYEFLGFLLEKPEDVFVPELAWEVAALIHDSVGRACTDMDELTTHSAFGEPELDFSANLRDGIQERCLAVMQRVLGVLDAETTARYLFNIGYVSNDAHRLLLTEIQRADLMRGYRGSLEELLSVAHSEALLLARSYAAEMRATHGGGALPYEQLVLSQHREVLGSFLGQWGDVLDVVPRSKRCPLPGEMRRLFVAAFRGLRATRHFGWFQNPPSEWLPRYLERRSKAFDFVISCWRYMAGG